MTQFITPMFDLFNQGQEFYIIPHYRLYISLLILSHTITLFVRDIDVSKTRETVTVKNNSRHFKTVIFGKGTFDSIG